MFGFFETAVGVVSSPALMALCIAERNASSIFSWSLRTASSSIISSSIITSGPVRELHTAPAALNLGYRSASYRSPNAADFPDVRGRFTRCLSSIVRPRSCPNLPIRRKLTKAFSKKLENLQAAVALHFAHDNLVRLHKTMRVTPAMAANVTDRVWSLEELVERTSR